MSNIINKMTNWSIGRKSLNKEGGEIIFDAAEVALDSQLAEGILRELPLIGIPVNAAKAWVFVQQELAVRKLLGFFGELKNVSDAEKEKFFEEYPPGSEKIETLGDNLLLALERLDDIQKPKILGQFFSAYMKGAVQWVMFTRLTKALDRLNLELLPTLIQFYQPMKGIEQSPEELIHDLSLAGLVTVSLESSGTLGGSAMFKRNHLGEEFLRLALGINI